MLLQFVRFVKPWNFVFDCEKNFEFRRGDLDTKNLLGGEIFAQNAFFLVVLNDLRTPEWLKTIQYPEFIMQRAIQLLA
ncbi:hypothetical protein HYV71_01145 [Candidatus Uhrbacteria bacterium]|nr:hypothetical protein [Candidatus Uhrbacteria bacterium]